MTHGGYALPGMMEVRIRLRYRIALPNTEVGEQEIGPIRPGEILLEELLKPMGLSQCRLAKIISVDPHRINKIVWGKRRITAYY
jgi:hypothetical protein